MGALVLFALFIIALNIGLAYLVTRLFKGTIAKSNNPSLMSKTIFAISLTLFMFISFLIISANLMIQR